MDFKSLKSSTNVKPKRDRQVPLSCLTQLRLAKFNLKENKSFKRERMLKKLRKILKKQHTFFRVIPLRSIQCFLQRLYVFRKIIKRIKTRRLIKFRPKTH